MDGFATLLAHARRVSDGFALDVPESWLQGRTAYGGFSSALALAAAMEAGGAGLAPLRSAQLAMIAPVSGRVEVRARVQRQGRSAIWVAAEIVASEGVAFTGSFVFMRAVDSSLQFNTCPVPAELIPPGIASTVAIGPDTPVFAARHFEMRHAERRRDPHRPAITRWVRLSDPEPLDPMVELMLLGDALPPGVLPMLPKRVPLSSMHWQVNMLSRAPVTDGGWWLFQSTGNYAEKGCSSQRMQGWNARGEPVIAGIQSIALFG